MGSPTAPGACEAGRLVCTIDASGEIGAPHKRTFAVSRKALVTEKILGTRGQRRKRDVDIMGGVDKPGGAGAQWS